MRFAYIGTLNQGGTCLMRGKQIKKLLQEYEAVFIDTRQTVNFLNRIFQSIAFRYKKGPLIPKVNSHIVLAIKKYQVYDFIWIDKAIYLTQETTEFLKSKTKKLIHYTPDTAFYANRSNFFYKSLPVYDAIITTKSYDKKEYLKYVSKDKLILCTQGYDNKVHKPYIPFEKKKNDVAFIGLCEPNRELIIEYLLDQNVSVSLGGYGWKKFVKRNSSNPNLEYVGNSVRNEEYGMLISSARFGLGLLSKKFPELHTTRTFEIPACGTALLTEKNTETQNFFNSNEVIFYNSLEDMMERIKFYKNNPEEHQTLSEKGRQRVSNDGRDYGSILKGVLEKVGVVNISQ